MADTTAKAELQQHYYLTREIKLRQWYLETQSKDSEIQWNSRVRLVLKL